MKVKKLLCFCFLLFFSVLFSNVIKADEAKKIKNNYKNFGIIISGPSGVGKTTIIEGLQKIQNKTLNVSISATTRQKRVGEINGKHYYFIDKAKFQELAKKDEFIEYAENYGNYYGSPKRNYIESMKQNKDIIFALSPDGMKNAKKQKNMDFVSIFIAPPSEDALYKRLSERKTETEQQVKRRFENARNELKRAKEYDYVVYNVELENAIKQVEAIYLAEQKKREF